MESQARVRKAILYVLILLPLLINAGFIKAFSVNVPIVDDWFTLSLFDKLYSGHLTFADLVKPIPNYPAYTTFIPKVIRLGLGMLTHYNVVAEMYFDWLLMALAFSLLFKSYIKAYCHTERALLQFIPVGWLLFSLRQISSTLWGGTMGYYFCVVGAVGAFYFLEASKKVDLRFLVSILFVIIATFSSGGIFIWPIGLIQIVWLNISPKKEKIIKAILWCASAVVILSAYLLTVKGNVQSTSLYSVFQQPLASFSFLVTNIGAPLSWDKAGAFSLGILLIVFYAGTFAMVRSIPEGMRFTVSIIMYSVMTSVAILLVRGGLGLHTAVQSRYTVMTSIGVVGAYLATTCWFNEKRTNVFRPFIYGAFLAIVIYGLIESYTFGAARSTAYMKGLSDTTLSVVRRIDTISDEDIRKTIWDREDIPALVRDGVRILKKYELSAFYTGKK